MKITNIRVFWLRKEITVGHCFLLIFYFDLLSSLGIQLLALDEDVGSQMKLGVYVVIGLYWLGRILLIKATKKREAGNHLLDKILDEDEAKHLFEVAKRRRQIIKEENYISWRRATKEGDGLDYKIWN